MIHLSFYVFLAAESHKLRPMVEQHVDTAEHSVEPTDIVRITIVAVAGALVWFQIWDPFPRISIIGIIGAAVGMYPIVREAVEAVADRRMTVELSMSIAILAALAIGEFFTALVIILFVLIAEVLEGLTVSRGRKAIKDLLDFLPRHAVVQRDGESREIDSTDLQLGDVIVIYPGARIPADGDVVRGNSFVDQSTITGEMLPVEKLAGASVFAGTINQSGVLRVKIRRVGRDTAFGRIIDAVEAAEKSKAPIQKTADRLAGYLVYFAIACAVVTFLMTNNVRSTISVVIVAGACGIAAGTPLAILGGIGRAARQGAIIKGGLNLESLSKVDTIVLDKTGTLTLGEPEVVAIDAVPAFVPELVLRSAAIAERSSEHPLARAVLRRAAAAGLQLAEPADFRYIPGRGIICSSGGDNIVVGNKLFLAEQRIDLNGLASGSDLASEILVAQNGQLLGRLRVADRLRPEAVDAVAEMRRLGLRVILLTGDADAIAKSVGQQLGIDAVYPDLLPEEKLTHIQRLVREGRVVAMVGDGINDAPALMQAHVGVAMGSGTDVARESANIMLLGNDLLKFVETLKIARWCNRIIMTNFAGTLIVDGIGVGLAAFGVLNPLFAAFIHVASELAFILNSARLLPRGPSSSAG